MSAGIGCIYELCAEHTGASIQGIASLKMMDDIHVRVKGVWRDAAHDPTHDHAASATLPQI